MSSVSGHLKASPSAQAERILPDGCIELILNFGAQFSQHCDDTRKLQPKNFLVGQMTGPIMITPSGPVQLIGIRFHPGGTLPFIRMPMHEVTDQVMELGSLSSALERDLLRVAERSSVLSEKIRAIEEFLTTSLTNNKHDSWSMSIAARIIESRGLVAVEELAIDAGISSRQMERRFLSDIGVGPKAARTNHQVSAGLPCCGAEQQCVGRDRDRVWVLRSGPPDSRLQPVCTADAGGFVFQPERADGVVYSQVQKVGFLQYTWMSCR